MTNTCFHPDCTNSTKNKFCSRSCAASYNNSIVPRRKPEHKCTVCGGPTTAAKRICSKLCRENKYTNLTLGELRTKSVRHAQVYNSLRQRSRRIAITSALILECFYCSWAEHVEVCHIRDLAKLPDSVTVQEATDMKNFVLLCPNHHWKFDHDENFRAEVVANHHLLKLL